MNLEEYFRYYSYNKDITEVKTNDLTYNPKFCLSTVQSKFTIRQKGKPTKKKYSGIYFSDFETDTSNIHKAYCCSLQGMKQNKPMFIFNKTCVLDMLNYLPDKSLLFYHKLSYDILFQLRYEFKSVTKDRT